MSRNLLLKARSGLTVKCESAEPKQANAVATAIAVSSASTLVCPSAPIHLGESLTISVISPMQPLNVRPDSVTETATTAQADQLPCVAPSTYSSYAITASSCLSCWACSSSKVSLCRSVPSGMNWKTQASSFSSAACTLMLGSNSKASPSTSKTGLCEVTVASRQICTLLSAASTEKSCPWSALWYSRTSPFSKVTTSPAMTPSTLTKEP